MTNDNGIKTLETIRPSRNESKGKFYLLACFIVALSAVGIYFGYVNQSSAPEVIALEKPPEPKIQATQQERIQQLKQTSKLKDDITAMQTRQKARDSQVQAYLQSARTPLRVPDLPEITPLEAPQSVVNRAQLLDQLDINAGYTLPKPVMEKFTTETGLTQAEIDKAMNQ